MFRFFFLALTFFSVGCSVTEKPPKGTLRIAFPSHPTTLDPRQAGDFVSSTTVCLLYEGLTRCTSDGSSELALAEKVSISPDQKTYTFHLRDACWSDGTPVTAMNFERSWKQILEASTASPCAYLFFPILNAEEAFQGRKSEEEIGIRSIDDKTLEVTLIRPTPYFLSLTSFPSFLPASQNSLLTNGPFCLKEERLESSLVLEKNFQFWNAKNIRLDAIHISIIPNEMTAFEMFERKEIDWVGGALTSIPTEVIGSLKDQNILQYFPTAASTFCSFNTTELPFSNESIRKAFFLALNLKEIAEEILPMDQIPATRCIPPALCNGENRNILPSFNPELAVEYLQKGLEESGLKKSELGPITLSFRINTIDQKLAQVMQKQWEQALGVEVLLEQQDFKTQKHLLHQRQYQVAIAHWISQYHDPINILERFKSNLNAKNYPGWQNSAFSTAIERAQETLDPIKRSCYLLQAEDLIANHLPIAPIYHWNSASLSHRRLHNLQTTPNGGMLFERCWIEE